MDIRDLTLGQVAELRSLVNYEAPRRRVKRTPPKGRAVIVVDRGWIFAGDMSLTEDGLLRLDKAVHVFRWESMGFAKMLEDWKSTKVDLRPCASVEIPLDAVVFRVPVEATWGLR